MAEKKVPYSRKPQEIPLDEWQRRLRSQFAKDQQFKFKNIGDHPVYSDFEVFNPETGNTYKVSIRDNQSSYNFCSCPDFTINGLGTCKHVEYVLFYFSKYKKYQKYLNKPHVPSYSSLSIYYGKQHKVRLKKALNADLSENEKELFDDNGFLKPGKVSELESFISKAKEKAKNIRVYPDVYEMIDRHEKNREWDSISSGLFKDGIKSKVFENLINATLYPYQKLGVQKIVEARRILLADEMGLGKTIQAIAATEIFAKYYDVKKVLIISPTSLKYQWKREIQKFSGRNASVIEGNIRERKEMYFSDSFYKIISYGICRNDLIWINKVDFDLIIIDEAQRIKNWKTKTAQAVKKISSAFAIVLTGTPLENRIDELHSIVEYIDRYKLGPLFRFLDKHQVVDEKGRLKGYQNLREIKKTLDDILLRRTKNEIKDQLPGRMDKNFFVEMTKEQQHEHDGYYELVSRMVSLWIRQGFLSDEDREKLLKGLNCMRMTCDSTYLLDPTSDHGNKIKELMELLPELIEDPQNKMVIFSQWKRMFELVIKQLEKKNIPYLYLNGDIPAKKRKDLIEEFQSDGDYKVFLSTDAGGVGVNLQKANVLINLDLPWNPAVLEQRIGRIYRLGQKKYVNVFNFISRKSIEHRILYLLDFKRALFDGVIEDAGDDEVMLEGFMESVKAMTDVNFDDDFDPSEQTSIDKKPSVSHSDYSENSSDSQIPPSESAINDITSNNEDIEKPITQKQGIFSRLKKRIHRFIKRIIGG